MIDYDKLKLAHELALAFETHYLVHIVGKKGIEYTLVNWLPDMPDLIFFNIDELISKLTELNKPLLKYKVGQQVWYLYKGTEIIDFKIKDIFLNDRNIWEYDNIQEPDLYISRESLIEYQINYWTSLLQKECNHEIDGKFYFSNPPQNKCKKCGEFYR